MNCLDFRRRCIAEPGCFEEDYLDHKSQCASCAALVTEMEQFDQSLEQAIKISPPVDLVSRVLLKQSMVLEKSYRRLQYFAYAMAASVLVILGLTIGILTTQRAELEQAVISYISHELEPNQNGSDIQTDQLRQLFKTVGMQLDGDIGVVNFAEPCYVRDEKSLHMVMTGEKGPVTILFMPKDALNKPIMVDNRYFYGVIFPCPKGSMAIVGKPGEELDVIRDRIRNAVTWL